MPIKKMMVAMALAASAALFIEANVLVAQSPAPQLVHTGSKYQLQVDGHPFIILGGQAHNSSASNPEDLTPVWNSLVAMHANTAEVPIYWELIEPRPGQFDFHLIDDIIQGARSHGLRLVLLWFGTWKNGAMTYTPTWIKEDQTKYFRVRNAWGEPTEIISPFCAAARQADERAFAAVMEHIKSVDEAQRTVIMMQVENETGLLGTDRDYSPQATRMYQSAVPSELMGYLERHRDGLMPALKAAWAAGHFRRSGTWSEVFGDLAPEAFSAWYVARFVDAVAAAGKQAYSLPMYCNNWLVGPGAARAGDWPSGGPTIHVLDIWKAAAPHINLLAPDIYLPEFLETAAAFRRPDNPLYIPETGFLPYFAPYVFPTLAEFNGIGFCPFGIDHGVENGKLTPQGEALEKDYRVLEPLLTLIEKYQYTGRLFAIVQDLDRAKTVPLGHQLAAVVHFTDPYRPDFHTTRAGGIIVELSPDDYVVAGSGFRVDFCYLQGPERSPEFLSLEEGTFEGETWKSTRRLNGDEFHVVLPEQPRILRVRLLRLNESALH